MIADIMPMWKLANWLKNVVVGYAAKNSSTTASVTLSMFAAVREFIPPDIVSQNPTCFHEVLNPYFFAWSGDTGLLRGYMEKVNQQPASGNGILVFVKCCNKSSRFAPIYCSLVTKSDS
jgi:hypothetical protein